MFTSVKGLYVGFFVMTFITPPIALLPYKDENAPFTTSVLSIMETGISDHKAPLESPVSDGLPSNNNNTLEPAPYEYPDPLPELLPGHYQK